MSATTQLSDRDLLARLIRFDSVSTRSNLPLVDFLCEYLQHENVRLYRNYNRAKNKSNLVAYAGRPNAADAGITLCAHLDVVPADETDWQSNPFELAESTDRFIGRGVCDMKGFLALATNAFLKFAREPLRHPLALLLTFDEELGTLGAQHFAHTWPAPVALPRHTLVGEPTDLKVVRMHKGHLKLTVTVRGQSAHSAYAHLGKNAIEIAARIVHALGLVRDQWQRERTPSSRHFPDSPAVGLNVGLIDGGSALNIVPDRCSIRIGIRLLPDTNVDAVILRIKESVAIAAAGDRADITLDGISPALLTSEHSPLYGNLCELTHQQETYSVSYATDGGPLAAAGHEPVIFGPGSIETAHKANEWLPKSQFLQMSQLLEQLITRMCIT